jgi:hypothetical protein
VKSPSELEITHEIDESFGRRVKEGGFGTLAIFRGWEADDNKFIQ